MAARTQANGNRKKLSAWPAWHQAPGAAGAHGAPAGESGLTRRIESVTTDDLRAVAQGYASLGQIGFSERSEYTAIGTVCNVAARLCGEA